MNSCPGKCPRFLRMVNYKRSTARQGRSPLYLTWDAVILTQAALLGPISFLSLNASLKLGTFLASLRRRSYLAVKSRAYKRPVVNYNAVLLFPPSQTTASLVSDVNHSFLTMATFETSLRPKYLQSCYFERFTSTRKLFLLLLYGPAGK